MSEGQDLNVATDAMESDTAMEDAAADDTEAEGEDVMLLQEVDNALVLPVWEPTGEPRVDDVLDQLTELDPDDVHQHAEVYTAIHQRLRDTLSDLHTTA
ncbi:MAG: hypothetical protein O2789_03525 [Actinomycetota bacterium]|nr:hypothetical protein [Actinomycetota bacterium]